MHIWVTDWCSREHLSLFNLICVKIQSNIQINWTILNAKRCFSEKITFEIKYQLRNCSLCTLDPKKKSLKPNELENFCQSSASEISLQYRKRREIKYKFNYFSAHEMNTNFGRNLLFQMEAMTRHHGMRNQRQDKLFGIKFNQFRWKLSVHHCFHLNFSSLGGFWWT